MEYPLFPPFTRPNTRSIHAFSLVELSIVLVILGLLTGGILGGKNLMRAAEIRKIGTEATRYKTAVYTFRDKYFALPGDMPNAHDFWDDGSDGVCGTAAECNGDGDGKVNSTWPPVENYRFWQHLSLSGLIEGNYTGTGEDGTPTGNCVGGLNVPRSVGNNSGFIVFPEAGGYGFPDALAAFQYGAGPNANHGSCMDYGALSPEEGWNLDTKLDDGKSDAGMMHVLNGGGGATCLVNQGVDNSFALQVQGSQCRFFMKL